MRNTSAVLFTALASCVAGIPGQHDYRDATGAQNVTSTYSSAATTTYVGKVDWYYTGLGACGHKNKDSDHVVALSDSVWTSAKCGKQVKITWQGKSHMGKIVDSCPGCPKTELPVSKSLFKEFAPLNKGVLGEAHWEILS